VAWLDNEVVRIAVAGEIDVATSTQLKFVLLAAIQTPSTARDVTVDLAEVTFMDASGVGVLVAGREAARRRGVGFTVQNPQGIVLRVLDLLGLAEAMQLDHGLAGIEDRGLPPHLRQQ
jgi:anti-anti-sigma factor